MEIEEKKELKVFLMGQLSNERLALPTIRKLASALVLVGCSLFITLWPSLLTDMVETMKHSSFHLRNGLVVLERLPE